MEEEIINLENEEVKPSFKKLNRHILILLILFIITTITYYICKIFDPFKDIVNSGGILDKAGTFIKYSMIVSLIFTIIFVIFFILNFFLKFKFKYGLVKKIVDILEWVVILPICIAVSSFCFSFLFTFSIVNGQSMMPTLHHNDQLLLTYQNDFERFDIVVIDVDSKYGIYNETLYVKRIIGMPGEYLEYIIEDGKYVLHVNGERITEPFTTIPSHNDFNFEEIVTKNGLSKTYKDDKLVIPNDYYLVLGDNRANSQDSRAIGLIHKDDIIGVTKYKVNNIISYELIDK